MDENKNLNPENETVENTVNETETVETKVDELPKEDKKPKKEKVKKPKKLKNQSLLRQGGFSVAITAAVLAGLIVLNVLVTALAKRFDLEFDMSSQKINSMSDENKDYLKNIDQDVEIIVCASEDTYTNYMGYYAQQYSVTSDAADYYSQTVKLLNKYPTYNSKIKLRFVDTQSTEFTEISSKYSNERLNYGDVIVTATKNDTERHKVVGFKDIYSVTEDSQYAAYGYTTANVSGNNVETAVTSAISYVVSDKSKKVALLTGHSKADYTADYVNLLKTNNYEVDVVSDAIVNSVSADYDAVIIAAPTNDFIGSELDAISAFLENDGKLGKGLIFYADASAPYLKNLYDLLGQWGISVEEGIVFETNSQNFMPDDPMTLGSYPTSAENDITSGMQLCITGLNVPITAGFDTEGNITVTSLISTPESTVAAPVGTTATWKGAGDYTKKSYSTVIQSKMMEYDDDNNEISSYVMAFSSSHFLGSQYNEQASVANKNITLAATERAVGAENTGISFVSKTITNESFADSVTESSTIIIRALFMFVLPLVIIIAGIYIFIRRKNA